jgi:hypothetical protein
VKAIPQAIKSESTRELLAARVIVHLDAKLTGLRIGVNGGIAGASKHLGLVPHLAVLAEVRKDRVRVGLFFYRQRYESFTTPTPLAPDEYLVIGFLGGLEAWDADDQGVRKVALKLRAKNLPGVHVETVEDRKRALALELIGRAFDHNRDGILDAEERRAARLILYGMSFGGAAVVKLARQLQALDIPVLLTIQVDSVGWDDEVVPSNVRAAANLYQDDGLFVRGERAIRAEDPSRTAILGDFRFTYRDKKIDLSAVPWYKLAFRVPHSKMNVDAEVWARVEALILDAMP